MQSITNAFSKKEETKPKKELSNSQKRFLKVLSKLETMESRLTKLETRMGIRS